MSSPRRGVAMGAITALLVSGLVTLPAAVASAEIPLPGGATAFLASQTDSGRSEQPSLTPDGQRVAFASTAADLVPGDTNGVADVFFSAAAEGTSDPFSEEATLISAPDASLPQAPADGASSDPVVSADGRYVAFLSSASNLVGGEHSPGGWINVYMRDTVLGTTKRMEGPAGEPLGDARSVDMSDDGRYVVFVSEASNLTPGDTNETWDGYIADTDANADGTRGDVSITRVLPDRSIPFGMTDLVISGNGEIIAFHTLIPLAASDPTGSSDYLYRGTRSAAATDFAFIAKDAYDLSVDATGEVFAYISDTACSNRPTVIASTYDPGGNYWVAIGWNLVEFRSGTIEDPIVSADGGTVAWVTDQPRFSFEGIAPPLPEKVVRVEDPAWDDATTGGACTGVSANGWRDVAEGVDPSPSASARTIALSGPQAGAPAATASVVVVDRHTHAGLSVVSTQGETAIPGYMTIVDIAKIPLSGLRDYAAALANAPIHRLPIHRLPIHRLPIHRLPIHRLLIEDSPIHRLPIHRLPIHRLPIHRLDIPGGWPELLVATPFGTDLLQSVTLAEVLDWAAATLAPGSTSTVAEREAALRIQDLSLEDVDLDDSGIDGLSLASLVLGGAPLSQVELPGPDTPTQRWQAVATAQALSTPVEGSMFLADLDAAGLDIDRSGVEAVTLRSLPVASTLFDAITMNSLFLEGTPLGALDAGDLTPEARTALFGRDATGPLSQFAGSFLPQSTVADLALGVPGDVTFGSLLFSLLDTQSYPWEQISPTSISPTAAFESGPSTGCNGKIRCEYNVQFRYTFDPGPGERTTFVAPTASATLPVGSVHSGQLFAAGSGPLDTWQHEQYGGPVQSDGTLVRLPLPDMPGGTTVNFEIWHTNTNAPGETESIGTLTSGDLSATSRLSANAALIYYDNPANNRIPGGWDDEARYREPLQEGRLYYEWISPAYQRFDEELGRTFPGPALDEDYFRVRPPDPGERLVISTNAMDGQLALALFSESALSGPLGTPNAGAAPGTPVTEQSGSGGEPAEAGGDAAAPFAGFSLVDQASVGGDGTAMVEAAPTDAAADDEMLLRVTSGNGVSSSSLYSLRATYIEEPAEVVCTPSAPASPSPLVPVSDAITEDTNTIYLMDSRRFDDTHGAGRAAEVRTRLDGLDGTGFVGSGAVDGAVLSVDADEDVRAARGILDQNPCSMTARANLAGAINAYVAEQVGERRDQIASIVLVGGDDVLPLAPVAQHTGQFNEASHAADLRRVPGAGEAPCPASVPEGSPDPCATPLSAAAATNHILTDDPYGLADAYESFGDYLYVPTVAVGRLIESPEQIIGAIDRFAASNGVLEADSTLTGGYGAWSELPAVVTENLSWRTTENTALSGVWDKSTLGAELFGREETARVVSINTHADETRLVPGIPNAESGSVAPQDLFVAEGRVALPPAQGAPPSPLAGSLVFMIGCHAGGNLPTAYYGPVDDWADVFSSAGGFVGNTGFGLANSVTTALSERLLGLYSDWIGAQTGDEGDRVSAAGALTYAKQSYLGGRGLYSGYDEKVLMQTVYYGMPMYTFSPVAPAKGMPLPEVPADLTPIRVTADGLLAASLSLTPEFSAITRTDDDDNDVSYLTADGAEPLVVPGQPILPKVVSRLSPPPADDLTARGVLITGLSSKTFPSSEQLLPAIAQPTVGVAETAPDRTGVAFPSTFATVTHQDTPDGPVDLLVTTPGRVEMGAGGTGVIEQFTSMDIDVVYAPSASTDRVAPGIKAVVVPKDGGRTFEVIADDTSGDLATGPSGIETVLLLAQEEGEEEWKSARLASAPRDLDGNGVKEPVWVGEVDIAGPARWIIQVVDRGGNVAIETGRGRLDPAAAPAPELGAVEDASLVAGDRLLRGTIIEDAAPGERLNASFTITRSPAPGSTARGVTIGSGPAVVETDAGGVTRATVDRVMPTPGEYAVELRVCRGAECALTGFDVVVGAENVAPEATVTLTADTPVIYPSSTLVADGAASDVDDDTTTLAYRWYRNGGEVPQQTESSLELMDVGAAPGDVIEVAVIPNDGTTDGHVARAVVTVEEEPEPPAGPVITATASAAGLDYLEGTWSTSDVTVSYTCTSGVLVLTCPETETVSADTTADGVTVTGTMSDMLGRSATATVFVLKDGTAPALSPAVTPNPVALGATATATPNAEDPSSGVASESCATPATGAPGAFTVACEATDVAGNRATASASYVVSTPAPPSTCLGVKDRAPLQPVNADGSSVFHLRSAVPVNFRACDWTGKVITDPGFVTGVTLVSTGSLPKKSSNNESWAAPLRGFSYSPVQQMWVGTIPTADLGRGKVYTYRVNLADGTWFTLKFGVR
ncbi:MAG TPA: hypothetical protein VFY91_02015 [Microbacterium sp.]|nr:hypothetical protein [Microbacterium sp.]